MKKMLIVFLSLSLLACGGGGSGDSTQNDEGLPAPDVSLPDIIDNHEDGMFMYADPSLYVGTYPMLNDGETCSAFFGEAMPDTIKITSMSENSIIFAYDGKQETHPGWSQDVMDYYYFDATFLDGHCGYGIASSNVAGQTIDRAVMYCQDALTYESCSVRYERQSNYDFTSTTVKSGSHDIIEGMKLLITHPTPAR